MNKSILCFALVCFSSLTGCYRYYEGCYEGDPRNGEWVCPSEDMRINEEILLSAYEAEYGEISDWEYSCFQDYVYREVETVEIVTKFCDAEKKAEGCTRWAFSQKTRIMVQYHDLNNVWTHNTQRHELLHLLMHCTGDDSGANEDHTGSEWELIRQLSNAESNGDFEDLFFPNGRY